MRQIPSHRIIDNLRRLARLDRSGHVGRHRQVVARLVWPTRAVVRRVSRSGTALAASALACLAFATVADHSGRTGALNATSAVWPAPVNNRPADFGQLPAAAAAAVTQGRALDSAILTDAAQEAAQQAEATRQAEEQAAAERAAAEQAAAEQAAREEAARKATNPTPVAGLNQTQMNNAWKIVQAGQALGLPKRAFVIAVATSMQECNLYNLASTRIPESYNYNPEGSGSDHDSVGLFQQRPSAGWGSVANLMDPTYAATAFYNALVKIPGWETMALTWAAQRVQVSAYPTAYAKHEARAQEVVDALVPSA
jgi:hypothetical protein